MFQILWILLALPQILMKSNIILAIKSSFEYWKLRFKFSNNACSIHHWFNLKFITKSINFCFFQLQLWSVHPEDSALSSPEPVQIEAANRATGYDQEDGVCDQCHYFGVYWMLSLTQEIFIPKVAILPIQTYCRDFLLVFLLNTPAPHIKLAHCLKFQPHWLQQAVELFSGSILLVPIHHGLLCPLLTQKYSLGAYIRLK